MPSDRLFCLWFLRSSCVYSLSSSLLPPQVRPLQLSQISSAHLSFHKRRIHPPLPNLYLTFVFESGAHDKKPSTGNCHDFLFCIHLTTLYCNLTVFPIVSLSLISPHNPPIIFIFQLIDNNQLFPHNHKSDLLYRSKGSTDKSAGKSFEFNIKTTHYYPCAVDHQSADTLHLRHARKISRAWRTRAISLQYTALHDFALSQRLVRKVG